MKCCTLKRLVIWCLRSEDEGTAMSYISRKTPVRRLTAAAVCLALCLVLPFLTGQIPQIGSALCPMHIPVLLAGFICGPWWAAAVGVVAPLLRHVLFGMPPILTALAMCFELAAYGLCSGLLYGNSAKKLRNVYLSLVAAMIVGRVVWGMAEVVILGVSGGAFTWTAFASGAVLNAVPGILVQIILIPVIVVALRKANVIE